MLRFSFFPPAFYYGHVPTDPDQARRAVHLRERGHAHDGVAEPVAVGVALPGEGEAGGHGRGGQHEEGPEGGRVLRAGVLDDVRCAV